jgi:hydroxylamine reductase
MFFVLLDSLSTSQNANPMSQYPHRLILWMYKCEHSTKEKIVISNLPIFDVEFFPHIKQFLVPRYYHNKIHLSITVIMFLNRARQSLATRRFFSTVSRLDGSVISRRTMLGVAACKTNSIPFFVHNDHYRINSHGGRLFSAEADTLVNSNPDMFCRQCEQTQHHFACTTRGVCGKSSETSALQDTLIEVVKAVSLWCVAARQQGGQTAVVQDLLQKANVWTLQAAFSTLTNVNFDDEAIVEFIRQGVHLQQQFQASDVPPPESSQELANTDWTSIQNSMVELEEYGISQNVPRRQSAMGNDDCFSLNEIGTYGLKGACAYAAHCYQLLGTIDEDIMKDIHEVWAKLASNEADMDGLLHNALRVGEINARVMAMLDSAHAERLGVPEPTPVRMTATEGKAILVSGHDLADLEALLKQTEGKGINVYTHGEMLPAHAYPGLKNYPHLVGNYGTAWQNQKFEFAGFPGPIVVTTNCIEIPRRAYKGRLYTMNEVGVPGVQHIGSDRDFTPVIEQALEMKGFPHTIEPAKYHTVGFNHRAVLPLAGQVIEAVQSGALSRIVLIGGCDGTQWDRK